MIYVPYEVKTGKDNMQTDYDLLEYSIANHIKEPIFRLYGWQPACISLGRNQKDDFLDYNFLRLHGIDVVRRLTGGRALLHDDEITYSFICPVSYLNNGEHVIASYKELCQYLIDKFKILGINLEYGESKQLKTGFDYCMLLSTGADLCYHGRKLIGSAQCRMHGYILQHGSILYNYDKDKLESLFNEPVDCQRITCISEINSRIMKEDIINILSGT